MPTNNFGGTYIIGTISVTQGETVVTGTGVIWSDFVDGLDTLMAGGSIALVDSVNGTFDEITLLVPWEGPTLSDADYVLLKNSPLRYEPALTQAKVRELLLQLDDAGIIYYVLGDEPDAGIGEDGQYALKTNTLPWVAWLKIDGVWVLQSQWGPLHPRGAWSAIVTYGEGALVEHGGYLFASIADGNINHTPNTAPASSADWTLVPIPGVSEVLDALGIHAITISEDFPSGGQDGDLWFKVA